MTLPSLPGHRKLKPKIASQTKAEMNAPIRSIRGMNDILPQDIHYWHTLEQTAEQVFAAHGFEFVAESQVLKNPEDDLSLSVFDPQIKGLTSKFVYKFTAR